MGESKEPAVAKIGPELSDTQRMMYAFGDSRRPKAETAKVLETVVLSQITGVVAQVITHISFDLNLSSTSFQLFSSSTNLHTVFIDWFPTDYFNFPGCEGGHFQGLKDSWSGGLALPHETQSCQGEKQQPQKRTQILVRNEETLISDFQLNLDKLFSYFHRCKDWWSTWLPMRYPPCPGHTAPSLKSMEKKMQLKTNHSWNRKEADGDPAEPHIGRHSRRCRDFFQVLHHFSL